MLEYSQRNFTLWILQLGGNFVQNNQMSTFGAIPSFHWSHGIAIDPSVFVWLHLKLFFRNIASVVFKFCDFFVLTNQFNFRILHFYMKKAKTENFVFSFSWHFSKYTCSFERSLMAKFFFHKKINYYVLFFNFLGQKLII